MSDTPEPGVTTLLVKLTPNAARNAIQGWMTDNHGQQILKIHVTATPKKMKANTALISFLSKAWRISPSCVTIVKGATDQLKTLKITADINAHLDKQGI